MNYISQINAFYVWLETNNLSHPGRHLWHALMHVANRTGWKDTFNLAIGTIHSKTGMSEDMIKRARNDLKRAGLIEWESRGGNKSAEYRIIFFAEQKGADFAPQSAPQSAPQPAPQPAPQSAPQPAPQPAPIPRLDKTRQDGNHDDDNARAREDCDDVAAATRYNLDMSELECTAQGIGLALESRDLQTLERMYADYGKAWLIEAIERAASRPKDKRSWGYVSAILKSWREKGGIDDAAMARGSQIADSGGPSDGSSRYSQYADAVTRL